MIHDISEIIAQHSKAINSLMIRDELQVHVHAALGHMEHMASHPRRFSVKIPAEMVLTFRKQLVTTPNKNFMSIPHVDWSDRH